MENNYNYKYLEFDDKNLYNIKEQIDDYFDDVDECSICKDNIILDDKFYICKYNDNIKHIYHKNCLDKWIEQSNKSTCLLCMKLIYTYKGYYIKK